MTKGCRFRTDDGGNFIIVTGILVALAVLGASFFASSGITHAGPDSAPEERVSSLAPRWTAMRDLFGSEIARRGSASMTASGAIDAFDDSVVTTKESTTTSNLETFTIARHAESAYLNAAGEYDVYATDGTHITGLFDGVDDGVIFADGGTGRWIAVVADLKIADGFRGFSEVVVFAVPDTGV